MGRWGIAGLVIVAGWTGSARGAVDWRAADAPPQPIVGGRIVHPGEFDSVVAILQGPYICTGTVVAPRLVLTAAHCLVDVADPSDLVVIAGDETVLGVAYAVERFGAHPEFDPEARVEVNDYGYVVLDRAFEGVDAFVPPIRTQAQWDDAMHSGRAITLVGYGEDPTVTTSDHGTGTKRTVDTTVRRLTENGLEFYAGGSSLDTCKGDSGGPAFVRDADGELLLAGITSRGSDPCGEGGYYAVPYAALCWVRDETGVDLTAPGCGTCECLDTAPDDESGCDVGEYDGRSGVTVLGLFALLLVRRARRRHAVGTR